MEFLVASSDNSARRRWKIFGGTLGPVLFILLISGILYIVRHSLYRLWRRLRGLPNDSPENEGGRNETRDSRQNEGVTLDEISTELFG